MKKQNKCKTFSQINILLTIKVVSVTAVLEAFATNKHWPLYELYKRRQLVFGSVQPELYKYTSRSHTQTRQLFTHMY